MGIRPRLLLPVALCICAIHAECQDVPKLTLFAGYSYMHGLPTGDAVSLNGWAAGLVFNLTRRLGVAANVSGDYGASSVITGAFLLVPTAPGSPIVSVSTVAVGRTQVSAVKHSFLFGPEFRLWHKRRATVRLMAGIGAVRHTLDGPVYIFDPSGDTKPGLPSSTGFATYGGVSADVRLTNRISYRLLQFNLVAARRDLGWQRNVQLATGLVLNLVK